MVSKFCTISLQCCHDKYFQHPLLIDGAIKEVHQYQYLTDQWGCFAVKLIWKEGFSNTSKLALWNTLSSVSKNALIIFLKGGLTGCVSFIFLYIFYFGFVMKHKYKDQNEQLSGAIN